MRPLESFEPIIADYKSSWSFTLVDRGVYARFTRSIMSVVRTFGAMCGVD